MYIFAPSQFVETAPRALELAVIIPTLNEGENVLPLMRRLVRVLDGIAWEAVFVDDGSTDATVDLLSDLARRDPAVRLIRRVGRRGLSTAVVEGMLATAAPICAVIDADLQHDERILPRLFHTIAEDGADMAIGTRYAGGGSTGDWSARRVQISRFANRLATAVLRVRLSDPMSGFFAIRRDAFLASLPRLSSLGYKIMLDIVASAPRPLDIREEPYEFRPRLAGASKLDAAISLEYGLLLADKTIGRLVPLRLLMFLGVGSLGLVVHLAILAALLAGGALPFWAAQASAVVGAMTFNFLLNNAFTYRDRRLKGLGLLRGLGFFNLACALGGAANVEVGALVAHSGGPWWLAGTAGAAIGSLWNYVASSVLTWRK